MWYSKGTISLTAGSTTAIGTGTAWLQQQPGWAIFIEGLTGPVEIAALTSATELRLRTSAPQTVTGASFVIVPTQGLNLTLLERLGEALTLFRNTRGAWEAVLEDFSGTAYQLWVGQPGNENGTIADFLAYLVGPRGLTGEQGLSALEVWQAQPGNAGKGFDALLDEISGAAITAAQDAQGASESARDQAQSFASTVAADRAAVEAAASVSESARDKSTTRASDAANSASSAAADRSATEDARDQAAGSAQAAASSASGAATDRAAVAADRAAVGNMRALVEGDRLAVETALTGSEGARDRAELAAAQTAADRQAVQSLFETFGDRYLGAFEIDPTTDNDGDAIQVGAIYWNIPGSGPRFYNGDAWEQPSASATASAQQALQHKDGAEAAQTASETVLETVNNKLVEIEAARDQAAGSAQAAGISASNAATDRGAIETMKSAVEAARDQVREFYLGPHPSAPTLDLAGAPVRDGQWYLNTTTGHSEIRVAGKWELAVLSAGGALVATANLADLGDAAAARANLGLGDAATRSLTEIGAHVAEQSALAEQLRKIRLFKFLEINI
jgi:hypothetical protein